MCYSRSMRNGTCIKCGHTRIRHIANVPDVHTENNWETRARNREFRVLGAVERKTGMFSREQLLAEVEAYVCADCGYFEEYVKQPADVPWEELPGSRWVRK